MRERPSLRTSFAALAFVALASIGVTTAATSTTTTTTTPVVMLPSCEGLPQKTCFGDRATGLYTEAGTPDNSCAACMQRKACCDAVGICDELPDCLKALREAHTCVLDGGPGSEAACVTPLGPAGTSPSRRVWDCMRTNCGDVDPSKAECKVSNCIVNPAVIKLANPGCDRCVGGSCCREVNNCYGDRRCKLALECIVTECKGQLGKEMIDFEEGGVARADTARSYACGFPDGGRPEGPPPGNAAVAGPCVDRCLRDFAPFQNGTADDETARCLAFEVYACSARSRCGEECTASTIDAEDNDAGADAGIPDADASPSDGGDSGPQ